MSPYLLQLFIFHADSILKFQFFDKYEMKIKILVYLFAISADLFLFQFAKYYSESLRKLHNITQAMNVGIFLFRNYLNEKWKIFFSYVFFALMKFVFFFFTADKTVTWMNMKNENEIANDSSLYVTNSIDAIVRVCNVFVR